MHRDCSCRPLRLTLTRLMVDMMAAFCRLTDLYRPMILLMPAGAKGGKGSGIVGFFELKTPDNPLKDAR